MKYKNKKQVLFWVKIGLISSAFLMLATPHHYMARAVGIVAVLLFSTHILIRHLMRKHFQKIEKIESDPEYLFEWLSVSWVSFLLGLFIPLLLHGLGEINTKTLYKILFGELGLLILYSLITLFRWYRFQRKQTSDIKRRMHPEKYPHKTKGGSS